VRRGRCVLNAALIAGALMNGVSRTYGQTIDFIRQFGTSGEEIALGVAASGSAAYVVGFTDSTLYDTAFSPTINDQLEHCREGGHQCKTSNTSWR